MSFHGSLLVACAALYAQAAVVYAWLWLYGRRRDAVSLGLSITAAGATTFATGAVLLCMPAPGAAAEVGARLVYVGSFVVAPALLAVAVGVAGLEVPRIVARALGAVMLAGLAASALGLVHSPSSVHAGMGREPALSVLGAWLISAAMVTAVLALAILARAAPRRAGARWLLVGTFPGVAAAAIEQLARLAGYEPMFAPTFCGTFLMLVASWVLLRRFAAVGDGLRAQQRALEESHAAVLRAQRDRSRAEHLAEVGELSVVLATEISRPMASLRRSVEHLDLAKVEAGEARAVLEEIDAETRHLNDLVGDLLVFARPSQEGRQQVQLATLVEDAVRDAAVHRRREPAVSLSIDRDLRIECEPEAMRRAVAQLVENAAAAAEDAGIRITAQTEPGGLVRLDVTDPGEGMNTVVRRRAFEPFFTTRPYGTGLGLAIVARVARAHGGSVDIVSAHGQGTTVTLRLPLADALARESAPAG